MAVSQGTGSRRSAGGRRKGGWLFLRDVAVIFLVAVLASVLIKTFLVRSFFIPSASMQQTLHIDDRVLVNQLEPGLIAISRGDVIVFEDPGGWLTSSPVPAPRNPIVGAVDWVAKAVGVAPDDANNHLIKRVIGLPGDHVVCCDALGQLSVNGAPLNELSYIDTSKGSTTASAIAFDVTVPPDSLWVMGDNRNNSEDSRYHQDEPGHGFVPYQDVTGRALFVTWPADRWTILDNHPSVFAGVEEPPAS